MGHCKLWSLVIVIIITDECNQSAVEFKKLLRCSPTGDLSNDWTVDIISSCGCRMKAEEKKKKEEQKAEEKKKKDEKKSSQENKVWYLYVP